MEISILNNPLYIAYTLHPGSKLAKVLPEDCQDNHTELVPMLYFWVQFGLQIPLILYCGVNFVKKYR